ncbi:MAG TPA: SUMF1/EgtB/PvdO family nonheme iron enzyme, partial [Vicinamibacterales bacterium]|nr:SUMF1/EgtB/PvdO family nonheme iron enzyme [Vicinamibacterales bacterium]
MTLDRAAALSWYQRNRERSRALFDMLPQDAYYERPIDLRHPIVFYDGHLPGFSFNTLVKKAAGEPGIDARLESLFARGIDPHESRAGGAALQWPGRDAVRDFVREADTRVVDTLKKKDVGNEPVFTILEHEAMHQETLLYMWHRLPFDRKKRPAGYSPVTRGSVPQQEWIEIPSGRATLGVDEGALPFAWDNEMPAYDVDVAAFSIQKHDVTNAEYMKFVEAGAHAPLFWEKVDGRWCWRGMFELIPLPMSWPVYVSQEEASAFARWRGGRLPTEAEYQRAAIGASPVVCDFTSWDPEPAGSHPEGASRWGVEDLVGNGWEWTSTPFAPFPGFRASISYPEYSADFFDGEHFVMKGASPATARELIRPSFRTWFRPKYPYVYATF